MTRAPEDAEPPVRLSDYVLGNDPDGDTLFGGIMDGIMDALRTSFPNPAILTDPWTGVQTLAANTGEDMTYDLLPPAATKNQRTHRWMLP